MTEAKSFSLDRDEARFGWYLILPAVIIIGGLIIYPIIYNIYLMILSRLQSINTTYYEAAEIDGASPWQKFRHITLPELYLVVGAIVILRVIWNFNKFEEVYLLTDNVKVLSVYTYFKAFTGAMQQGQGASLALIQFLLLVAFILFYVKRVLKW